VYDTFLKRASELHSSDEPFAAATVVRCERPTSGKPGDRAIISKDGKLSGWIGGGCAQPIVIQEALKSLQDGVPRLIRVSPTAGADPVDGITGYTMMCHSGGTLDIFIEPVLPKLHLVIFGRSPVAQTLAKLAKVMSYRVSIIAPEESRNIKASPQTSIVVATQGEDDEGALEQALSIEAPYLAFVASNKKWEAVRTYLREKGFQDQRLNTVRVPAGLDIGASSPEEIAVSILAQVIQERRKSHAPEMPKLPVIEPAQAKDPVCGMMVNIATAKYNSDYDNRKVFFCCAHCKSSFDKDPGKFMSAAT